MTNLIFQWGTKKYFPPICTVPTWGKKYHLEMGGGEEYDFWEKYKPLKKTLYSFFFDLRFIGVN